MKTLIFFMYIAAWIVAILNTLIISLRVYYVIKYFANTETGRLLRLRDILYNQYEERKKEIF